MLNRPRALIVVAHPDDETLWFTSILVRYECDVVCVTSGATTANRRLRRKENLTAGRIFGVRQLYMLGFPDIFVKRLPVQRLIARLRPFRRRSYDAIYTHGPYGEVNEHSHHQDVCYAVHMVFPKVWSTAWNLYPEKVHQLSAAEYIAKKTVLGTVYAREYRKLKTSYELSSIEKFVMLSRSSVEVYYWSIGNFGDNHQRLGIKYRDMWGYSDSPYEIERHAAICTLARSTKPDDICEVGAHEGVLTAQLAKIAPVVCTESAPIFRRILAKNKFVVRRAVDASCDLTVIASTLEYMDNPTDFLQGIRTHWLLVDVISTTFMRSVVMKLKSHYRFRAHTNILPRWEKMFINGRKQKLEVYKLGAYVSLWERK